MKPRCSRLVPQFFIFNTACECEFAEKVVGVLVFLFFTGSGDALGDGYRGWKGGDEEREHGSWKGGRGDERNYLRGVVGDGIL